MSNIKPETTIKFINPATVNTDYTVKLEGFVKAGFPSPANDYIEKELNFKLEDLAELRLGLRNPDLTTARRIAQAINGFAGSQLSFFNRFALKKSSSIINIFLIVVLQFLYLYDGQTYFERVMGDTITYFLSALQFITLL